MSARHEEAVDHPHIRKLFADYLRMYAGRDDRLTAQFSEDFSGFTGGGDFLVKDREAWVAITRQDFAQVKEPIRIELKDLAVQSLAETLAVATGFFSIHLPIEDHVLSRETARLVLIFRLEAAGWKICHSSISIPYHLVREGEVYPLKELVDRNQMLEELVAERTAQLSEANENLRRANDELAREIAVRKRADEALQRSEQRYRSIVNASPDDITITDPQGRILMVSPAALTMFRWTGEQDFLGRSVFDYLVPEDRGRAAAQVARKRDGGATGPSEYRAMRHDGSTLDIEVNSEFIRDAGGAPTGIVVIVRDITERRKLEAQTRQLQKAESLDRMAGSIAHHFNNQLQAVMMGLQMAMDGLPADPAGALESMKVAIQSARKAAEMSNLMRTYLGHTVAERERLDLSKVCDRGLSMLRVVVPRQVVLETASASAAGPTIPASTDQIQRLLANLVTNAWEACGDRGGRIRVAVTTVSAAEIPTAHRFPIDSHLQAGAYACLEVADTGCGIAEQDIEKIFDPFFSTKFPGRGLGLAVVLGTARALDGAVTVESRVGHGSVFRVFLPTSPEAAPPRSVEG